MFVFLVIVIVVGHRDSRGLLGSSPALEMEDADDSARPSGDERSMHNCKTLVSSPIQCPIQNFEHLNMGSLPPGLDIYGLSLPDARYEKNEKKIEISVDDKVQWSYKWTNTFEPLLSQDLHMPLSSTVKISLVGKHYVFYHLLGSYSGRVVDFLFDAETPLTLQNGLPGACAIISMALSPLVDYQQAWNHSVDASLGRLDNNKVVAEGFDNTDRAVPDNQAMNYYVETRGRHIAPLGQALRLMDKLIANVAEGHPLLNVGWTSLSSAYTEIQEQRLDDRYVQTLAETFRDAVGVASDCRVAEIKGPHGIIPSIERLALEIASLIDEYFKKNSMTRLDMAQIEKVPSTAHTTACHDRDERHGPLGQTCQGWQPVDTLSRGYIVTAQIYILVFPVD
ncbi:hypothetical protein PAXINDRAFT_97126 [Paxillus involutus ATCC 200175]|nr:hypothetical protein PAXINDRAFT_97126 [Paxillus involutus ATCC 200175]